MASRALRRRASYRALNSHQRTKSRPLLRLAVLILVAFTMVTSGASAATIFFYGQNLPSLKSFKSKFQFQDTIIRDRYGNVLYDMADVSRKDRGRRVVEPLVAPGHTSAYYRAHGQYWLTGQNWQSKVNPDQPGIPLVLQNATIATEDATFYDNPGFDPVSIMRAAIDNVTKGHVVSGASTITQQLIRRYMLSPDPTLTRKVEEIVLAAELTQKYPKSQILWYYLNSVPYGNLAIGAEAAAKTYFNKHVWQLDLAQSAFLAGLPEAPSTYDPVNNLPAAKNRMSYVLYLMNKHGYLRDSHGNPDPGLITQAMNEANSWKKFSPPSTFKKYPHFVQYAINQLFSLFSGKIYSGLDVTTTIDPRLQDAAQSIVSNQISQLGSDHVTDGALVSLDIRPECYGCVLAMVGSADYKAPGGQYNMADSPRQPGSSFKPFNYIKAFLNGLSPSTTVLDGPIAIPDSNSPNGYYTPTDYDQTWHGVVTLRVALQNSLNVPAVKVEQFNAEQNNGDVRDSVGGMAVKLGIKSLFSDNPNCCGWALTLGGLEHGVRLVQETSAYGAFATGGKLVTPWAIRTVRDRTSGKVLWDVHQQSVLAKADQVLKPDYAYEMTNVLSDNASRCTPAVCEFGLDSPLNLGRPAAAKTGTTNSFTDNWTVGYTPDIVTGVWVGNVDNSQMIGTTGVTGAAPIWNAFMLQAFKTLNLPPKDFQQPSNVYFGSTCRQIGTYGTTYSATSYDVYADGIIPLCSVGTDSTSLPVPQTGSSAQSPPAQAPVPPPAAAVAPTAPPVVQPTPAPLQPAPAQPTAQPAQPSQQNQSTQPSQSGQSNQPIQPAPGQGTGSGTGQP